MADDTDMSDSGATNDNPTTAALSDADMDAVVRTMLGEAGNQGPAGQAAVAAVIKNRLASGQYGNTASDVAKQPGQFDSWNNGTPSADPDSAAYDHAQDIAQDVWSGDLADPTNGATHFYANKGPNAISSPKWANGATNQTQIGDQLFMNANGGASSTAPTQVASSAQSDADTVPSPKAQPSIFSLGKQVASGDTSDLTGGLGALATNFMTGGAGTLFGLSPDQSHGIGSRLDRLAALWAPPAMAQTMLSNANAKPADSNWQTVGGGLVGKSGAKGLLQINPQGGYRFLPAPTAAQGDNFEQPKTSDTQNFSHYYSTASAAGDTIDEINSLEHQLTTNPNVYGNYNISKDPLAFIDNSEGMSTDQSQFVKSLNSAIAKGVIAIQQGGHFSRPTNMIMQTEKQSLAPNGALNDPLTTWQSLERLKQQMQEQYAPALAALKTQKKKFGDNLAFDPDDYDAQNQSRWSDASALNQYNYKNTLGPYHAAKQKGGTPLSSFLQQKYGAPNAPPGSPPSQAPAPAATPAPSYMGEIGQAGSAAGSWIKQHLLGE